MNSNKGHLLDFNPTFFDLASYCPASLLGRNQVEKKGLKARQHKACGLQPQVKHGLGKHAVGVPEYKTHHHLHTDHSGAHPGIDLTLPE